MNVQDYINLNSQTNSLDYHEGGTIRLGQIDRTYFIDDDENVSKKFPEYDVVVYDDTGGQSTIRNVRALQRLGSSNDCTETILEDNQYAFKKQLDEGNTPQNKNGTLVFLVFLDGSQFKPYILAAVDHPLVEGTATREKGFHSFTEYRGLRQEVNKDGELEITFKGPKNPDGKVVVEDQKPISFKIGKTGTITAGGGHQLLFESGEGGDRFQIITAGGQKFQIEDTEGEEAISLLHKSGAAFEIDVNGGIKQTSADESSIFLDADANKVTVTQKDGHTVTMTPSDITVKDQSGGALKIASGKVALGGPTAELLDLFEQLLTQMDVLITNISSSTHVGNLGFPTAPPVEAAAYTPVQSQVAAIKTLLGAIKGSL